MPVRRRDDRYPRPVCRTPTIADPGREPRILFVWSNSIQPLLPAGSKPLPARDGLVLQLTLVNRESENRRD